MKAGTSRHRWLLIAAVCGLAICAVTPSLAGARITNPPGATEGDQYFEEVPNGGGSASPDRNNPGGGSGGSSSGGAVAADQTLRALGSDGQAAADLANANRPPTGKQSGSTGSGSQPASSSSSTEGQGGMGVFLPLLIAGSAVAAIAYGLRRRMNPA